MQLLPEVGEECIGGGFWGVGLYPEDTLGVFPIVNGKLEFLKLTSHDVAPHHEARPLRAEEVDLAFLVVSPVLGGHFRTDYCEELGRCGCQLVVCSGDFHLTSLGHCPGCGGVIAALIIVCRPGAGLVELLANHGFTMTPLASFSSFFNCGSPPTTALSLASATVTMGGVCLDVRLTASPFATDLHDVLLLVCGA